MTDRIRNRLEKFVESPMRLLQKQGLAPNDCPQMPKDLKDCASTLLAQNPTQENTAWVTSYIAACRREKDTSRRHHEYISNEYVNSHAKYLDRAEETDHESDSIATELLKAGRKRFATENQFKCYELSCHSNNNVDIAKQLRVSGSRIVQQLRSAEDWGIAGGLVIACEGTNPDFVQTVFSNTFSRCTPLRREVVAKFDTIVSQMRKSQVDRVKVGLLHLWEKAVRHIVEVYGNYAGTTVDYYTIPTSSLVMLLASRLGGDSFKDAFHEHLKYAKKHGVLKHNLMARQFCEAGSYCGEVGGQITYLNSESSHDIEISAVVNYFNGAKQWPIDLVQSGTASGAIKRIEQRFPKEAETVFRVAKGLLGNRQLLLNEGLARSILCWFESLSNLAERTGHHNLPVNRKLLDLLDVHEKRLKLSGFLEEILAKTKVRLYALSA